MKKAEIEILSDQGDGKNIFEQFAGAFERAALSKERIPNLYSLMESFLKVERLLQDIGEIISSLHPDIALTAGLHKITGSTKKMLAVWMALFESREKYPEVPVLLEKDLLTLIPSLEKNWRMASLAISESESGKGYDITSTIDFDSTFLVSLSKVKAIEAHNNSQEPQRPLIPNLHGLTIYSDDQKQQFYAMVLQGSTGTTQPLDLRWPKDHRESGSAIEDGEDVTYTWTAAVWIDSREAGKANKFMYGFCAALLLIEGVNIEIVEAGVGSFFQRWLITIKGWFAKEEVIQVVQKAVRATEAYGLDRHIEPVEKIKAEREKIAKDIEKMEEEKKRMMTEGQIKEMHELDLASKREAVKAQKLANIKQYLEVQQLLSERMSKGFIEVDSDYRIMINDLLAINQKNNVIETGDIGLIGEGGRKELSGSGE